MARWFVQYLTIYNIENLPNSIKMAKVAKFRQIWSHLSVSLYTLSPFY